MRVFVVIFVLVDWGWGCMGYHKETPTSDYVSVFDRRLALPPVAERTREAYPPLPEGLRPAHRPLMAAYERFGFASVDNCVWTPRACNTYGWICEAGMLSAPFVPSRGSGSDGDLPRWVECDAQDAELLPNGFEEVLYRWIEHQREYDETPPTKRPEFHWLNPPRDSRHLVWTTFAHWALERQRLDLFTIAMAEVEKASAGRCHKSVGDPLTSAVLANAAASKAATAKSRASDGKWEQARAEATFVLSLLSHDVLACEDGRLAKFSAASVLRRAELELALEDVAPPATDAPMEVQLDYWLFQVMRSGLHSAAPDRDQAIGMVRVHGEAVVPHLLPHMDEMALYRNPISGLYGPPTTLGDVVVRIIEDIAGQEFTASVGDKSQDIGGHLAIYAWWAGRQKILEEEAEAAKPKSLWEKVRDRW